MRIYVDNGYYAQSMYTWLADVNVDVIAAHIDVALIARMQLPCIVAIDHNALGAYEHMAHYVAVLRVTKMAFYVYDPWQGKTRRIAKNWLAEGVRSLRELVRICPVIITQKQ